LQEADVSGAFIVQPTNHQYDHRYLNSVLKQYPDKFVGCLLADPTPGGGGAAAIEHLAKEHGYRAVRFNPYLWPEGEKMTNEVRGLQTTTMQVVA
jgi:predicted TIM-barrel fold metal-dependent hydrolase